ncbi:MAG: hypothetical protein KJ648_07555 [Candidatus Omnitrophica bacterium]|nr:hypothetical protein [Candidatus Omnitrophota bacterium]
MKYLWKQCTTSGASPLRAWDRGRQNTLRRYGCEAECSDCEKDSDRYAALMRLVERKRSTAHLDVATSHIDAALAALKDIEQRLSKRVLERKVGGR